MKKLLNLLMISSLITSSTSLVISCRGGAGMSVDYTDQEKMLAITTLNTKKLTDYGVKLGGNISKDQVEGLLKLLGLDSEVSTSARAVMTASVKAYIMANQLLSQISSKVPGYGWINSKLQWQSQRWGFAQLFTADTERQTQAMSKNASGWLKDEKEWSLSVTFLDEQLIGWTGNGSPKYARININKKIEVDLNGDVIVENSFSDAVHPAEDGSYNVNALDPVVHSKHEQTKGRGYVYQGFVNSSSLIDLDNIYDPNDTSIPGSIFSYTPSATDFVNNLLLDSDLENNTLIYDKDFIESTLNDLLTQEPIYLSEGMNTAHIDVKLKNRIFAALFRGLLDRRNPLRENSEEDLTYGNSILPSYWSGILSKIKVILEKNYLNEQDTSELKRIESSFQEYRTIDLDDSGGGLDIGQINTVYNDLLKVIKWSHNNKEINTGELSFAIGTLRMNLYKRVPIINGTSIQGTSMVSLNTVSSYREFGFNGGQQLVIQYYNQIMPEEQEDNLTYDPDGNKDISDREFISDAGFKNVFFAPRFTTLLQEYTAKHNQILASENIISQYPNSRNALVIEPFNLDKITGAVDANSDEWFEKAGYLNEWLGSNATNDDWRIRNLINAILVTSKSTLIEMLNPSKNSSSNIKQNNIANYDISSEYLINGVHYNQGLIPKVADEDKDDDIAFYELITKSYNPFHITDSTREGKTDLREDIYTNGLNQEPLYSPELRIMNGNISTYGEILDSLEHDQWWSSNEYNSNVANFKLFINLGNEFEIEAFKNYWDRHVRMNPDNPDHLA